MKKKLLSLIMATAMILSLAVPAFAAGDPYFADGTTEESLTPSITFAATTFVPTISLTVPALNDNPVVLNPYKITYTGDNLALNGVAVTNTADQTKQVISPVYGIKNFTDAKLKFTVSATTTVADTLTLSQEPVAISETKKSAHIVLVIGKKELDSTSMTALNDSDAEQTLDRFDTAAYESITLKKGEVKSTATNMAIAPASGTDEGDENYLVFQFQGDMSRTPTTAWLNTDTLSTVIKFTFTPDSAQDFKYVNATSVGSHSKSGTATDLTGATFANIVAGATLPDGTTAANIQLSATPAWAVVTGTGSYGAKLDGTTGIKFDKDAVKATAANLANGDYTDSVVLSFNDVHGIPRTIEYTYKVTVAS